VAIPALLDLPGLGRPAQVLLWIALAGGLVLLLARLIRTFLYKVGRRLAFSYFLLGILPIPMVALLLGITAYLLSGSFLGHLYHDGVEELTVELELLAETRLKALDRRGAPAPQVVDDVALAVYRDGRRVGGDERAPSAWPSWATAEPRRRPILILDDGRPSLGAFAGDPDRGAIAFYTGDLQHRLSEATGILIRMKLEEEADSAMEVSIGGRETVLKTLRPELDADPAVEEFFGHTGEDGSEVASLEDRGWLDRPWLRWGLVGGSRLPLAGGTPIAEYTPVSLVTTPRVLHLRLFIASAELDAYAWVGLLGLATLLFWLYFSAALMAIFFIYGLSSAVNRLSEATAKVQTGDFSVRIPVRRRDQLGDLQRSFNDMAGNLEEAVHAAAQTELLEKELSIARELQQSLIPQELPTGEGLELAALFEPSAAIGGDYFDIFRVSDDRLAVVVADVSGHGLPTGLRMAMLKAALSVLIERAERPEEILQRLDALVRSEGDRRFFVTATLALLDLASGELTLLNAGHPPTYLLRQGSEERPEGEVEEVALPGSPLGVLTPSFGRARRRLRNGDLVVWLSDGLIEATDENDEPFGYTGVSEALDRALLEAARTGDLRPERVKDRLLAAVREHVGDRRPDDDLTLVVLRWSQPPTPEAV